MKVLRLVFALLAGLIIEGLAYSQQGNVLENEFFVIHYPPKYEQDAKEALDCAMWVRKQTMTMYPHQLQFKVNIYLNASQKETEPVALTQSGGSEAKIFILRPSWQGSWGGYEQLDYPFRRVLNHEYVHAPFYKDLYTKSSGYSNPPGWFCQGIAEYISQNYLPSYEERVKDSVRHGSFMINEEYSWGIFIVEYMYIQYGQAKIMNLIKSAAPTFFDALKKELGVSQREFEQGWQTYLQQEFSAEQPLTAEQSLATVSVSPKEQKVKISEKGEVSIEIENAKDLAGFQLDIEFNPKFLDVEVEKVAEGDFLKNGQSKTFWKEPVLGKEQGTLNLACTRITPGGSNGNGVLVTVSFTPKAKGQSSIEISNIALSDSKAQNIPSKTIPGTVIVLMEMPWDVNENGKVDIFDLVLVGQNLGKKVSGGPKDGDVNSDGLVDIFDLVLIGQHFGEEYAKPAPPLF